MIFGTDGLRAKFGTYPLVPEVVLKLSQVIADELGQKASVVIARDTRQSGEDIAGWITARFNGITIHDLREVPTPVLAYETKARGADLGIMITASHNPACDNGLKFFGPNGLKVNYARAKQWSEKVLAADPVEPLTGQQIAFSSAQHYIRFIAESFRPADFHLMRFGFDAANGAGAAFLPELTEMLNIEARWLGTEPNGSNINDGLGAMHPERLSNLVLEERLDAGFAFDGDSDRIIFVNERGRILHGDLVLYALKEAYAAEGMPVRKIVGTIMCGMGLEQTLAKEGIQLIRTPVGDQNVLAALVEHNLVLGGEPSGHIIQGELFPAGDGYLAALRLGRAMARDPELMQRVQDTVPIFPIFEQAYSVRRKPPLESLPKVGAAVAKLADAVDGNGRQIIRYSGTEQKLRVYVEAADLAPFQALIDELAEAIAEELE